MTSTLPLEEFNPLRFIEELESFVSAVLANEEQEAETVHLQAYFHLYALDFTVAQLTHCHNVLLKLSEQPIYVDFIKPLIHKAVDKKQFLPLLIDLDALQTSGGAIESYRYVQEFLASPNYQKYETNLTNQISSPKTQSTPSPLNEIQRKINENWTVRLIKMYSKLQNKKENVFSLIYSFISPKDLLEKLSYPQRSTYQRALLEIPGLFSFFCERAPEFKNRFKNIYQTYKGKLTSGVIFMAEDENDLYQVNGIQKLFTHWLVENKPENTPELQQIYQNYRSDILEPVEHTFFLHTRPLSFADFIVRQQLTEALIYLSPSDFSLNDQEILTSFAASHMIYPPTNRLEVAPIAQRFFEDCAQELQKKYLKKLEKIRARPGYPSEFMAEQRQKLAIMVEKMKLTENIPSGLTPVEVKNKKKI